MFGVLTAPLLVALASHLFADSSWVSFCATEAAAGTKGLYDIGNVVWGDSWKIQQ